MDTIGHMNKKEIIKMEKWQEMYEYLAIDNYFFTEEELDLLLCINGSNDQTILDAIYARYGYTTWEQFLEYAEEF